ncbi:MAG: lytic transglycosylase domain-containing protein [Rhodobacteraceae bacterium]|nr:lytic transglycosylase domain-containing protein [Paracoccaceae bacterium]
MKYPDYWEKNKDWHNFPRGLPLFLAAIVLTGVIWWFSESPSDQLPDRTAPTQLRQTSDQFADIGADAEYLSRMYNVSMSKSKLRHLLLYMHALCGYYSVDYALAKSVVSIESAWDSKAVSSAKAVGLMQIMPSVAKDYSTPKEDLYDPYVNLTIGVKHLARLEGIYGTNTRLLLVAYNEGPRRANSRSKWYINKHAYASKVLDLAFGD